MTYKVYAVEIVKGVAHAAEQQHEEMKNDLIDFGSMVR